MSSFDLSGLPDISASIRRMQELTQVDYDSPIQHVWSDEQFRILRKYIEAFESSLDPEHEVAIMLTNFGQTITMQVTYITYEEPVLMVFKGFVNGQEATLIQHVNQLNFLLTSMKKEDDRPKRKIGFSTESNEG